MNIITLIISGMIGLLLFLFFILLLTAITFNMKAGQKYRRQVAQAVNNLRLSKMLAALGINLEKYLHSTSMVDVHQQMKNCQACQHNTQCDEELASSSISIETVHFCNNKKHLRDMLLKQSSTADGLADTPSVQ